MRPVALGRRNLIHIGSSQAGPKIAALLSVVESYRRLKFPVRDYLAAVLPVSLIAPSNDFLNSHPQHANAEMVSLVAWLQPLGSQSKEAAHTSVGKRGATIPKLAARSVRRGVSPNSIQSEKSPAQRTLSLRRLHRLQHKPARITANRSCHALHGDG
jgi:hypothetical protein